MRNARSAPESFYDHVSMENMRDVGEGRRFDVLYRQDFSEGRRKAEIIKADALNKRLHFLDVVFISYDVEEVYRNQLMKRTDLLDMDWDYSGGSVFWDFEHRDSERVEGQLYMPDSDRADQEALEDLKPLLDEEPSDLDPIHL